MNSSEQKIYDDYVADSKAVMDKAKAAAAAIEADLNAIIGPTEAAVKEVAKDVGMGWKFLSSLLQFLDGPKGKFSHKRLIALTATVLSIVELLRGNGIEAAACAIVAVVLAIISAVTKT